MEADHQDLINLEQLTGRSPAAGAGLLRLVRSVSHRQEDDQEDGITTPTERASKHPAVAVRQDALSTLVRVGSLLGLDPTSYRRLMGGGGSGDPEGTMNLDLLIMAANPNVNAANKYARDVVSGRITAGLYVRQACQRHGRSGGPG